MKKFNSTILAISVSALLLTVAITTAFAAPTRTPAPSPDTVIDTEVDTLGEIPSETEADTTVETEVDTEADTTVETEVDTEADTTVETEVDTEAVTTVETEVDTEADTTVETEAVTEVEHTCHIDYASGSYHRYECDECENYARIYHDEENMTVYDNGDFFHIWGCAPCGYEYSEKHSYTYAYNSDVHYRVCRDCKHTLAAEPHNMVNYFTNSYHYIECDTCANRTARHIGVTFTAIDATSCQATCNDCGISEVIEHEWDGFECAQCNYQMSGFTCAVVADAEYNSDGYFTLELVVSKNTLWVDIDYFDFYNWSFDIGDFVQIFHQGNDIFDIAYLIDGEIVNDYHNFKDYIGEDTILSYFPENVTFDDIIMDVTNTNEEGDVHITFQNGHEWLVTTPYVVYDLRDSSSYDLYSWDAVLRYTPDGHTTYFVVIW